MKAPIIKSSLTILIISVVLSTIIVHSVGKASELTSDSPSAGALSDPGVSPNRAPGSKPVAPSNSGYSNKQIVHLLNRITFGPAPGNIAAVKKMGVDAYIEQQLHPQSVAVPDNLKQLAQSPVLSESPAYLFHTYGRPALKALAQNGGNSSPDAQKELEKVIRQTYQKLYEDTATARIARAVYSPAQLEEVMTDFWYNHFNISIDKSLDHLWVGTYEETAIRPYVLGKFRNLLGATAHHAAMLFYLDNWQNTDPQSRVARGRFQGINENYARELMELHTLGVDGGYTQKDVQELARILTGLGLAPGAGFGQQQGGSTRGQGGSGTNGRRMAALAARGIWQRHAGAAQSQQAMPQETSVNSSDDKFGSYFDARRHDFGDKVVVGHHIKGIGENEIEQVLDILARHPSTAHHISYQLAQYFVSDKPPATLVDKMSKCFLESDGDIPAVLETLFHSPEFWDERSVNAKFKSPYRYLISSLRATDADLGPIKPSLGVLTQLGMPLYKCLTPDGYKNTKEAWLSPDNLLNRINFATALGTGHYSGASVRLQDPADLADCIGPTLSDKTIDAVMKSPESMRISLLLGSPEFMKY